MRREALALILAILTVLPLTAAIANAVYVNTIIIQRIEDDATAIGSLVQGQSQARLFRIRDLTTVRNLQDAGFQAIKAASGIVNILVNPYNGTCQDGHPNIFADRRARLALQYLIPRDQIVSNIYQGEAIPLIVPWTKYDPDFPYLLSTILKWQARLASGGKQEGINLLEQVLQDLGASKADDGKWYWPNGDPVQVNFVIRVEDARKDIGELLSDILENDVGITVNQIQKDFSGAFQIVYMGDPAACEWQLYTEGWGITGMTKYDYGNFVWFYSSIWGGMPGWAEEGYWNYVNATIDEIATKLDSGNYTSIDEFWQLVNEGVNLGIEESVRVFIAATYDFYIAAGDVEGIIPSPKASPWHTFTFANLQYTEDTLVATNRYVYAEGWAWNPIGGWQDFYSRPVVEAIIWRGVTTRVTDGETGWSPAGSATWKLERGPVSISENAITYDPVTHQFVKAVDVNVTTAANKVIYNYKLLGQIKFHDGTTMTIADLLAPIYIILEYTHDASTNTTTDLRYESKLIGDYYTFINTFKAIEIINDTAVAVYTDYDHIDPGYIATIADAWTSFPLELYAAMDLLHATYSQTVNQTVYPVYVFGEPSFDFQQQIHLLSTEQDDKMVQLAEQAKNSPPDWVQQLIDMGLLTQEEWAQRVDNLANFYNETGTLVIANGPFYVASYDAASDIITLKRVADFPVTPEQIAQELAPKALEITALIPDYIPANKSFTIAMFNATVNGQPATQNDIIPYALVVDLETYEAIFADIIPSGTGQFNVTLPVDIEPDKDYMIFLVVYPAGYSDPQIVQGTATAVAVSATTTPEETTTPTETTTTPSETTTSPQTTTQPGTTTTPEETTTSPSPTSPGETTTPTETTTAGGRNTAAIAAAVIVIIIIIAAAAYMLRK